MKKQKLLRNLNSKGRYLTLLLTVTAGLLYCSSAWADYGFFDAGTGTIKVNYKDYDDNWHDNQWVCSSGCGRKEAHTLSIGTVKELWLKEWWAKVWKNGDSNITNVNLQYCLGSSGTISQGYNYVTGEGDQQWGHDTKDDWGVDLRILSGGNPGDYKLEYWFWGKMDNNDKYSNQDGGQSHFIEFTIPGFNISSISHNFGQKTVNSQTTEKITDGGYHHYGAVPTTAQCEVSGPDKAYFTVTASAYDGVSVKYQPTAAGHHTATLTVSDNYGNQCVISLSGNAVTAFDPTVLIGAKESVFNTEVTLNGYIKYTGCKNVTEYGFVYGKEATPTTSNNKEVAGTTGAEAGYSYSTHFDVMDNGTYYYRAYMIAGGTTYYSTEVRQFTIESDCPYYPSPKPELTLNGYVDNVICLDESVVAKCVSKPGFTYALFAPNNTQVGDERGGDGSTFVWQKNDALKAAGTYILKTKSAEHPECWAISAKATQAINSATMTIEAENDNPYAYQPVIIKKSADQDEFTKPTWEIKTAESGAYLLNYENKLIYSGKQVDKVLFKGNATDVAKQVGVSAAAYKTVEFEGGEKTCPAVVEPITITVKPADEVCPK